MFSKVLVANRGEIACRIIKTCRRMGVVSVAVYSDADADSRHVSDADEAYCIGPAPAGESYLCTDKIIDAVKKSKAEAIHPGYGFLSENAEFASACDSAGIVFIGPPVSAIKAMGSKSISKQIMEKADVPLIPGYHGDDQSTDTLTSAAKKIGYPLLIKASAGGGGKGMRLVEHSEQFTDMLDASRREAISAFGNDHVILEKYLPRSRHIEVQVFGDADGNMVHLYERDCSLQRRYQKILEETPAPGITDSFRRMIGNAAVQAAKAVNYINAGTVEFIVDAEKINEPDSFFFMEMNTRLQVEHPVTEMVTGLDLVEWQLRVACGEKLPINQEDIQLNGHAIEVRLYAENPEKSFLPDTGKIRHLRFPVEHSHIRVDAGVKQKDNVSMHYDPMLAKIISWSKTRAGALRRLRSALSSTEVVGISTNKGFLANIAAHPAMEREEVDTKFIDKYMADLVPEAVAPSQTILSLAALAVLLEKKKEALENAKQSEDPFSPWAVSDGWRLNDECQKELTFIDDDTERYTVKALFKGHKYLLTLPDDESAEVSGNLDENCRLMADLNGVRTAAAVIRHGLEYTIIVHNRSKRLSLYDPLSTVGNTTASQGLLKAPMHGQVVLVNVHSGDEVEEGQALMVLEAMKMEHTIAAPSGGEVKDVMYAMGDQVEEGADLIEFRAES